MARRTQKNNKRLAANPTQPTHPSFLHWPQAELKWLHDDGWFTHSDVLLSREAADTAIVFVHGWGGKAVGTWESFPQLFGHLKYRPRADLFFLDYPSRQFQVPFCAAQLRHFLIDLVRNPATTLLAGSLPSGCPRVGRSHHYKKVLIVAHSMGAVISRRALIDLDDGGQAGLTDAELERVRLLFFAPAHCGSHVPRLIASGMGLGFIPGIEAIGALLRVYFQSLGDLEEGSDTLRRLSEDNRALREDRLTRGAAVNHLVATVYHADGDRVVSQSTFDRDGPLRPVMRQTHTSICKPNSQYQTPLEALSEIL